MCITWLCRCVQSVVKAGLTLMLRFKLLVFAVTIKTIVLFIKFYNFIGLCNVTWWRSWSFPVEKSEPEREQCCGVLCLVSQIGRRQAAELWLRCFVASWRYCWWRSWCLFYVIKGWISSCVVFVCWCKIMTFTVDVLENILLSNSHEMSVWLVMVQIDHEYEIYASKQQNGPESVWYT